MSPTHAQLLAQAEASVGSAAALVAGDPLRPSYHLLTPAFWVNDPNGPLYYRDAYHMFMQHNPYGPESAHKSWAHAVSTDLAHWQMLPIALVPGPGAYDKDGIYSGCCVLDGDIPSILYTGVHPEVQCLARSHDGMHTWDKHDHNPVIPERPRDDLVGFRDPFAWSEGDGWYMVLGSGIVGQGGTALLYHSHDLELWTYLQPLCIGFGRNWECPNFFSLGDRHMLVVSPHGDVLYSLGEYRALRFAPGPWQSLDLGGPRGFYAPNCLLDPRGRRIMWGWIRGGGTVGYPWDGCLSLPRVLTLRPDGRLGQEPAPELSALRGEHWQFERMPLGPGGSLALKGVQGDSLELAVELAPGRSSSVGLAVRCSADQAEQFPIVWDLAGERLTAGDVGGAFRLLSGEETLRLRVFLDRSVLEVYANGRVCLTTRLYPKRGDALGVRLFAHGGSAQARSLEVWALSSAWDNP